MALRRAASGTAWRLARQARCFSALTHAVAPATPDPGAVPCAARFELTKIARGFAAAAEPAEEPAAAPAPGLGYISQVLKARVFGSGVDL